MSAAGGELAELRALITAQLGIQMPAHKVPMLSARLRRRVSELALPDAAAYERYLLSSALGLDELRALAEAVTTNKTDFFREPLHFRYLVEHALPAQGIGPGGRASLKVWCAGCSTGEEAYTLAMVLDDYGRALAGWDFGVLATDISPRVLAHARRAVYAAASTQPLPGPLAERYLRPSKDPTRAEVRVAPELRARVAFRELNFMDRAYDVSGPFDVIFFRNVSIYFDPPTQAAVVERLRAHLAPGGHLFLGQSETLVSGARGLTRVGPSIYRHTGAP